MAKAKVGNDQKKKGKMRKENLQKYTVNSLLEAPFFSGPLLERGLLPERRLLIESLRYLNGMKSKMRRKEVMDEWAGGQIVVKKKYRNESEIMDLI